MHTRALLADRIARDELCPGTSTVDEWLNASWVRFRFGQKLVPVIPLWGLKKALVAHDVHHVVLDCPTSLRGECELAGWELASGGCRWNLPFWIDRFAAFAIGLLLYPASTARGLRRGVGHRNLYGMTIDEIMQSDVEDLRRRMRLPDDRS